MTVASRQFFRTVALNAFELIHRVFGRTTALAQEGFFIVVQRKIRILWGDQAV